MDGNDASNESHKDPARGSMEMEMEPQTFIGNSICCDGLPDTLSTNYYKNKKPWLVSHKLDEDGTVDFYTMDEQPSKYRCRIPELKGGMRIQGFCHGWMILSNDLMWSLWNPVTSKLIRLPPLPSEGSSDMIDSCCLSSPPGDPTSILLLTRFKKPNLVFCRLDRRSSKRKRSKSRWRWTEMSYAKQLKDAALDDLTCCNGKVYAKSHDTFSVVLIDIKVVKDKQVVISVLPFRTYPEPYFHTNPGFYVLKGSGTELFIITGRLDAPAGVHLFKLDMTTTTATHDDTTWEEIHDLKDAVFFVEIGQPASYIPAVASGLGGYVHIRDPGVIINSFHVKDKTFMQLPMPCLLEVTGQVSMWEYSSRGLEADNDREVDDHHKEEEEEEDKEEHVVVLSSNYIDTEEEESAPRLLDVPFHVLEMIMEYCVGIEYMNLRASCKRCHLAAPRIHWRNKTSLRKLEKYSLVSPWLAVVQVNKGIMDFTDPISGDRYFMRLRLPDAALSLSYDELNSISCSKYGWWLFYARSSSSINQDHQLVFLNPFTNDLRKLPPTPPHYLDNLCFSAPPNCNNCVVVGFSTKAHAAYILRYNVEEDQPLLWRRFDIIGEDYINGQAFCFPTFHGRDLYALCNEGQVVVFKDIITSSEGGSFSQPEVVERPPWPLIVDPPQFFLMKRGQYLLLLIWRTFHGNPQLFQLNVSTKKWTQIHSLETDMVFIGAATCLCIEAKTTPNLQNNIYFPQLRDGRLIYYSLETSKFHTFDGKLPTGEEALFEFCCVSYRSAVHLSLNAWIEPSWY